MKELLELRAGHRFDDIINPSISYSTFWTMWRRRVLFPNICKFVQGFLVLVSSFAIVIQSSDMIDLFKGVLTNCYVNLKKKDLNFSLFWYLIILPFYEISLQCR